MQVINFRVLLTVFLISLFGCSGKNDFPVDKRYWTPEDYNQVLFKLSYHRQPDEKLPTFDDPEERIIAEKLMDHQNYLVVLEDEELGLNYRSEIATQFFNEWRDLNALYRQRDKRDMYVYDEEMVSAGIFGLGLQLMYFKLGNEAIVENAADPNSPSVKDAVNSNIKTLIHNYLLYLDEINHEEALSDEGRKRYSEGIDKYFTQLIKAYPKANFRPMKNKLELMAKKTTSAPIKASITKVLQLIEK